MPPLSAICYTIYETTPFFGDKVEIKNNQDDQNNQSKWYLLGYCGLYPSKMKKQKQKQKQCEDIRDSLDVGQEPYP